MDIFSFSFLTNLTYFASSYFFFKNKQINFEDYFYIFFFGSIIVSFISLFLNFFTELNILINSIIYLILLFLFVLNLNYKHLKNLIIFLIISSTTTFFLILYSDVNRPDAGLYHLPFVSILNEHKIIFGLNNIDSRFGLNSIIQYLSAINNNYLFSENGISIPLASIVSFFYIYFFYDVLAATKDYKKISISNFFSLLVLIYIIFKINRYSGFGNDAIGHLSFFYIISYLLKTKLKKINFNKLALISVFIFANKPMLGLVFLFPVYVFFFHKNFKYKKIINILFSFPAFFFLLLLLKNIILTGCLIYPIKSTCFENLKWTDINETERINLVGSVWSKAWPEKLDNDISMNEFNSDFNWVKSWSQKHLKYILKIIIPYIFILILIFIYLRLFKRKKYFIFFDKKNFLVSLIVCIIGSFSFFCFFPLYRYGYSYLISLIILLFIYFNKDFIKAKKNITIFKFFFLIGLMIIPLKQIDRIQENFFHKSKWPNIYTFGNQINSYEKILIDKDFSYYYAASGDNLCMYSSSPCTSYRVNKNIIVDKKLGYIFLNIK